MEPIFSPIENVKRSQPSASHAASLMASALNQSMSSSRIANTVPSR